MTQPAPGTSATVRLYTDTSPPPPRVFLDANVVLDIYEHDQATAEGRSSRRQRHPELASFLDRLQAAKCSILVTPHVLEEVFHVVALRILRPLLDRSGCADEKALRSREPAEQATARQAAVKAFRAAVLATVRKGASIVLPGGAVDGKEVYERFTSLLRACPQIGGKDAVHIITGALLGCTHFVTRDSDFSYVGTITVYALRHPRQATRAPSAP